MKNILVIGGAGYVGTHLVGMLLEDRHKVTVYDLFIYGNFFSEDKNLSLIKGDIRNLESLKKIINNNFDCIIHLACISNDPSFDLNPDLGKSINFDPFEKLVKISKDAGVDRFIYASSSSVYGVKEEKDVDENFSLQPLTDYSKYKAMCEDILLKYNDKKFTCCIVRPATVCGYSKRQRLDVVVNILTNLAYHTGKITIFGGPQLRPNININDMSKAYIFLINQKANLVSGEIYNVGFENCSVDTLGDLVVKNMNSKIIVKHLKTNDNRSYHISSKKIQSNLGFKNSHTIEDAIKDLIIAFKNDQFDNPLQNEIYFNIKRMKSMNLK
ncbi:SDR family oxidoreductase [Candidatus Pelagibacter ubique]|jgi:nucleoside-diphosphate-sugar epimerase|nr:SDR family oxidoreductase [Candidatus Pelagibacter ubique]